MWRPGHLMQHSITLLLGQIALTQPGCVLGHCPVEKQMIDPLNKSDSVTSKVPSHLLLHASLWEPQMWRSSVHLLCVSQRHGGWNQKSQIWTPDQRTDFHQAHVHCSCFLAHASLFLVVSFSSGFLAAIQP